MSNNTFKHKRRNYSTRRYHNTNSKYYSLIKKNKKEYNEQHICNLSSYPLSHSELSLLSKGLGFVPTPGCPDISEFPHALGRLKNNLRSIIHKAQSKKSIPQHPYKKTYHPKIADHPDLNTYISLTESSPPVASKRIRSNLTLAEKQAFLKLRHNKEIIIKKADKGSVIVVEDKQTYINEGLKHLADTSTYKKLEGNPTPELVDHINKIIQDMHSAGYIDKYTAEYLSPPSDTRTQVMYFLKKLHKQPHKIRPIVSGCSGPTERISAFLDTLLKTIVPNFDSFIKDSTSIIKCISSLTLPSNVILVTVDVTSLYTTIPQQEGIDACLKYINQYKTSNIPLNILSILFNIVLKGNIFRFNNDVYTQLTGTAMGTKMAPNYANCFMHDLEERFLESQHIQPLIWRRYIDDVILFWNDTLDNLNNFLTDLNNFHPTIKFTWDISTTKIVYLDLEIFKGDLFSSTGKLDITTHFKTTNTFQYLHFKSCHPKSTFKGIIKGETIRFIRSNTQKEKFKQILSTFITHLKHRGYPSKFIFNTLKNIHYDDREKYLSVKETPIATDVPRLLIPFSPHYNSISASLLKHWDVITNSPSISTYLLSKPQVCYKKNSSIGNKLVRANLSKQELSSSHSLSPLSRQLIHKSSHSLCSSFCITCTHLVSQSIISSLYTSNSFLIRQTISCSDINVIYALRCKTCSKLYVGKTSPHQTLKARHREHLKSAKDKNRKGWPLFFHFNLHNIPFENNHSIIPLQKCKPNFLKALETLWIKRLSTLPPTGLNHSTNH